MNMKRNDEALPRALFPSPTRREGKKGPRMKEDLYV